MPPTDRQIDILKCLPLHGDAVFVTPDIEPDCKELQSQGLAKSCRPVPIFNAETRKIQVRVPYKCTLAGKKFLDTVSK